jgi:hypothetical protein
LDKGEENGLLENAVILIEKPGMAGLFSGLLNMA